MAARCIHCYVSLLKCSAPGSKRRRAYRGHAGSVYPRARRSTPEGTFQRLRLLLRQPKIEYILGMDVSHQALSRAAQRLHLEEMPPRQRRRIDLIQGSLLYRDERLAGFDAAALVEVIEHLDENRLAALEAVVFGQARPAHVFVTTPNADYNQLFEKLSAGEFRHDDHRFEWTRAEFAAWAEGVAGRHGYQVRLEGMGEEVEGVGAPSQMAVFGPLQLP